MIGRMPDSERDVGSRARTAEKEERARTAEKEERARTAEKEVLIIGRTVMGLFDVSEEKKRAKEIKKEGKMLRKWVLLSGLDKKQVDSFMDEFLSCVEQGVCRKAEYLSARAYMESSLWIINEILPQMRELPVELCRESLQKLL